MDNSTVFLIVFIVSILFISFIVITLNEKNSNELSAEILRKVQINDNVLFRWKNDTIVNGQVIEFVNAYQVAVYLPYCTIGNNSKIIIDGNRIIKIE